MRCFGYGSGGERGNLLVGPGLVCRGQANDGVARVRRDLLIGTYPEPLLQRRHEALGVRRLERAANPSICDQGVGYDKVLAVVAIEFIRNFRERFALERQESCGPAELAIEVWQRNFAQMHAFRTDCRGIAGTEG